MLDLVRRFGAHEIGAIGCFFDTTSDWLCPVCFRSKDELARLDKNGNLLCAIHSHHDHFGDLAMSRIRDAAAGTRTHALNDGFYRFPNTLICNDCNVIEGYAKSTIETSAVFSFAPHEIGTFIIVTPNAPHRLDRDRLKQTYEAVLPSLRLVGARLRAVLQSIREDSDDFEHIGGPAWRAIKAARQAMQKEEEDSEVKH